MKKVYLIFSFIILCKILSAQVLFDIEKLAQSESKSFKTLQNKDHIHSLNYGFDIIYHDLYFDIHPAELKINGIVTSIIKLQLENDSVIRFDCAKELNIDSVKRKNTQLYYYQTDSNELVIQLGSGKINGQLDTFQIYYHGIPSSNGFGSFSQTFHQGIPNIWTLSEPYGSRDWWPCKQTLDDKIDSFDIHIKTPFNNLAASNGLLEKIDTLTDGYIFNWKHRYPIATYLIALSVTNYSSIDLMIYFDHDSLTYLNYVYPENYIDGLDGALMNIQVMKLYNQLFIPYPFMKEKYGHAQFGWGGGMEHQTMSFVSNFNFELLAHELAHQWFGDQITCNSWQDIWLNEGFATYLSGLCYENLLGGIYWPIFKKQLINKVCSQPDGSVFIPSPMFPEISRVFDNRLTYSKGAMVLHMLRWKIGDEAFFKGIKNYLNNPNLQYHFSRSEDFINEMELACGYSLSEFFNDWLYGEGFPSYTINWKQALNNDSITMKIEQTTSSTNVPFFEMPVPIKFFNNTQEKTIVFDNTMNQQFYQFDLGFKADSAYLDPDMWIVQKGSAINNISNDLLDDELSILNIPSLINDELKIEISAIKNEKVSIYLSSMSGQKIIDEQYEVNFGKSTKLYNTSKLSKGYYILFINAGKEKHSYKILKG